MINDPEPDATPADTDTDVDGHMFLPPDERGGGHPSGSDRPREGRGEDPRG
jgi:hypothetical protein